MASSELTSRQQHILEFVCAGMRRHGFPPTIREIARELGVTPASSIYPDLDALRDRGLIRRSATTPRTIEVDCAAVEPRGDVLTDTSPPADQGTGAPAAPAVDVPLLGRIAAGRPILAGDDVEEVFAIPQQFVGRGGRYFMLAVHGDSMVEAGILDGDRVIVRSQPDAEDGELVAARIGDEATVKRLDRQRGRLRLLPANRGHDPIEDPGIEILGRVVTVIRHYGSGRRAR
jgi:repressor LexA